ncbi:hypothetical protein Tco_1520718, partial [Tanacetum coccineum]
MAGESERDVKMATQLADAMDVGNGGVDQGINEGWHEVVRDKATSFFFTNFPDSWDSSALWKMFSREDCIIIVDSNLIINCARFNKLGGLDFSASDFSPIKKIRHGQIRMKLAPPSHSFKKAVLGKKTFEGSESPIGRLSWLTIEGLLSLGRHIGVVKDIVKDFGRVLEFGMLDF